MWTTSHTETARSKPEVIWARWTDVVRWPEQDASITSAAIDGLFVVGSQITLQPKGSPKVTVKLIEVTPNRSFSSVGALPLASLRFDHRVEPTNDGVSFTQSITITGPLAWLWGGLMGGTMASNLKKRMMKLAELANRLVPK